MDDKASSLQRRVHDSCHARHPTAAPPYPQYLSQRHTSQSNKPPGPNPPNTQPNSSLSLSLSPNAIPHSATATHQSPTPGVNLKNPCSFAPSKLLALLMLLDLLPSLRRRSSRCAGSDVLVVVVAEVGVKGMWTSGERVRKTKRGAWLDIFGCGEVGRGDV